MALSNIFREPRREITESVVGTVAFLGLLYADYRFGCWVQHSMERHQPGTNWSGFFVIGMVLGAFIILLGYPLLFIFPHFIGETICNLLADAGVELRPKDRRRCR